MYGLLGKPSVIEFTFLHLYFTKVAEVFQTRRDDITYLVEIHGFSQTLTRLGPPEIAREVVPGIE